MAAHKRWKKDIKKESIEAILYTTERHPYYLNRLCRMVWDHTLPPMPDDVEVIWQNYVETQRVDWISETISQLTPNQRAILAGFAKSPEKEPMGKEFSTKLNLASSSIQRTISALLKKDLIYKDQESECYHVLNPAVKTVLEKNKYFD